MTFKKKTDSKIAQVRIRFTPEEKENARAQAKHAGLTLSAYLRKRALSMPVGSRTDAMMINELRRLGGMVKLVYSKSGGTYSKETAAALTAITEAIHRIGT